MSNIPGLSLSEITTLMADASTNTSDTEGAVTDRFARAAWTVIAEPGDAAAGALINELGATDALRTLLRHVGAHDETTPMSSSLEHETLAAAMMRWSPRASIQQVIRAVETGRRFGAELLTPTDPAWPIALNDLGPAAPFALWVRGGATALDTLKSTTRSVTIDGARASTGYGDSVAVELAATLSDESFTIVNGASYGIAAAALRSALAATSAHVLAVSAGGIDRPYPSGHTALFDRIAEHGALISEVPCGTPPTRWRFLQSNRLKAALSQATVIVEAGHRSGALNTAGHATALDRRLGAVPGPVTSAASAGCHRLLREYDATCITNASDVIDLIGDRATPAPTRELSHTLRPEVARSNRRTLDELESARALTRDL